MKAETSKHFNISSTTLWISEKPRSEIRRYTMQLLGGRTRKFPQVCTTTSLAVWLKTKTYCRRVQLRPYTYLGEYRYITSERVNTGWWNLRVGASWKISVEFEFGSHGPMQFCVDCNDNVTLQLIWPFNHIRQMATRRWENQHRLSSRTIWSISYSIVIQNITPRRKPMGIDPQKRYRGPFPSFHFLLSPTILSEVGPLHPARRSGGAL